MLHYAARKYCKKIFFSLQMSLPFTNQMSFEKDMIKQEVINQLFQVYDSLFG